jgi:hypothetical protein
MCGANTGSLGLRTNAASRIHDSFRPVSLLKSQPSCCTSDKTTPWLNGRGTVENTTASSNCMHNQDTIATLLRESALLKASSSLPSLTSLVSSIVGSRDSSRCCKDSTYIHHVPFNTLTCPPQVHMNLLNIQQFPTIKFGRCHAYTLNMTTLAKHMLLRFQARRE